MPNRIIEYIRSRDPRILLGALFILLAILFLVIGFGAQRLFERQDKKTPVTKRPTTQPTPSVQPTPTPSPTPIPTQPSGTEVPKAGADLGPQSNQPTTVKRITRKFRRIIITRPSTTISNTCASASASANASSNGASSTQTSVSTTCP